MTERRRPTIQPSKRLLIPLASLIAVLPLILFGCSCGHDFDFHILNWLEAARQFTHGNLHPQWAFTPAYDAGEPRFVFYPPLSWTIGAVLGLILPWTWTPIIYTWLVLTAAGFALYRLARSFAFPGTALLASVFYLVNPYTLFTAYERTAYAELLAAVWIPLLLHAILRPDYEGGVTIPRIALPVALLWLTNAPAAVMSCYALALLTLIRLLRISSTVEMGPTPPLARTLRARWTTREALTLRTQTKTSIARTTATGTLFGLGLAAFYLIPAAYERRFVHIDMAILPGLRIQDNFLFHHTTDALHDTVLHTASTIAILLLALTALTLLLNYRRTATGLLPALTTLTVAIAFLLTPLSNQIWLHAPELAFLQFPWRLLAILAAALSLSLVLVLNRAHLTSTQTTVAALVVAAALTGPAYMLLRQPCDPEDTVAARVALFHSTQGSEPTDEYTPVTADNDSLGQTNPPYWLSSNPAALAPANTQPGPAPTHLALNSPIPQTLILNLRDYPAWRITLNQTLLTTRTQRDDGLIALPIPAGPSQIEVTHIQLPDQILGDLVSLLTLVTFTIFLLRSRKTQLRSSSFTPDL
ncbi:hypothetical protein [Granulicella sp. dw_53]|uniref:hypothetical protein n=1 Tax=Granulicella sp. dw_53 TaxID=2719792 RepID=UPI001BD5ED23|nr:hypothetical protein [Granulicella sp. dw_53]